MIFTVRDPQGFEHVIERTDDGKWWGYENVAHGWGRHGQHIIQQLLTELNSGASRLTNGFTYFNE